MKVVLAAIAVSFALIGAASAEDNPMARAPAPFACAMDSLAHHTSFQSADDLPDNALCPQFLNTDRVQLPRHDLRT